MSLFEKKRQHLHLKQRHLLLEKGESASLEGEVTGEGREFVVGETLNLIREKCNFSKSKFRENCSFLGFMRENKIKFFFFLNIIGQMIILPLKLTNFVNFNSL